jgi:hypothetical protein
VKIVTHREKSKFDKCHVLSYTGCIKLMSVDTTSTKAILRIVGEINYTLFIELRI